MAERIHDCSRPGCKERAWCTPVLVVPPHAMARTNFAGVRSILWLPLCQRHFSSTTIDEVLKGEAIAGMQQSIDHDFRQNGSIPDWKAAQFQPLRTFMEEYKHYEQQQHDLRQGKLLPAQTRH